jgi:hypothetical protein
MTSLDALWYKRIRQRRAHLAKDRRIYLRISALRRAGARTLHHGPPSVTHPDIYVKFIRTPFLFIY